MIEINNILEVEKYINDMDVVIFDLDDTLYSEKEYVKSGYKAIAREYPKVINMEERLWEAFLNGKKAIDYVLEQEDLLKEKGRCLKIYREHKPEISLYFGVREILERISKRKHLAMITDGRPNSQHLKIQALKINDLFEKIIITDELGGIDFRKPNGKSYILIKNYFNVEFDKCVYVGDNLLKDFTYPNKIGMKSIFFNNKDGLYYNNIERLK